MASTSRERRNPVMYAVDGYGVFSCVIGGMTDRTRIGWASMAGFGWRIQKPRLIKTGPQDQKCAMPQPMLPKTKA